VDRSEGVEDEGQATVPGRARIGVGLAVAGGLMALALGAGWIEREPIVAHFAARELAARHVPATYRIAALGPFAQRLEDVTIGDSADPDLTARVINLRLDYGLHGPRLAAVDAEGVRLKARVADGRVTLGAIDRLLPATSSNAPLALPDMAVTLVDTRVALATPAGAIAATVAGGGNLADGFRGRLVATSDGLRTAGCTVARPIATLDVRIDNRRPTVRGPIDLAGLGCGSGIRGGAGRATVDLAFATSLDSWKGAMTLAGFAGELPGAKLGALTGRIGVSGDRRRVRGGVALAVAGVSAGAGRTARAAVAGQYRYLDGGLVFAGDIMLDHAVLAEPSRRRLTGSVRVLAGTPIAPLATRAVAAADTLFRDADARATVALATTGPDGLTARIRALDLVGRSGGHVRLGGGNGVGWTAKGWRVDGRLTTDGGGLPALDVTFAQQGPGAPIAGIARLAPYEAGGARLALTPARFSLAVDGGTRFDTVATLDGPIGSGRIEGLTVPLAGRIDARGGFMLGAGCTPIAFRALRIAGVALDPARLRVCGIGGAPIASGRGGVVRAGVTIADARFGGRSGAAPLAMGAKSLRLAATGIAAEGLAVTLGRPDARTRLDVASLAGTPSGDGFVGRFEGAAGQIGHVPLLLSGAAGNWRLAGGVLSLTGAMDVADAAPSPRFHRLAARDVALRLADGRIAARGTLHEPKSGALVANVTLRHDLASGQGGATLDVPELRFDKTLQPEALTPLTLGVIANVGGVVTGRGEIDWTAQSVTSGGDFRTDGVDFAAAFGPVKGLAGAIRFSDLLGLVTLPHQTVTIAEVNPGIAVPNGTAHFQLIGADRIRVEDASWPFAGGDLALEPSLLTFGQASERHLTFRVTGLDAAAFVQQLAFPNISATGTFDGVLPMIFDDSGGRIEKGLLTARQAGGTLAYIGELSNAQLGQMGKLAFDALKAIRYRSLSIGLDGKLDGEIVSLVKFEGVRQATGDAGVVAKLIYNLPFRFNISIRAPFRGLMGSARTYADPDLLLKSGLLQPSAIQPSDSETMR
jgi:hypothetical protein